MFPGSSFFFSSRRRHTRSLCDWSSDVCSSDLRALHYESGVEPWDRRECALYGCGNTEFKDHAQSQDQKSTRLNSSHTVISYAVFCLKKKKKKKKRKHRMLKNKNKHFSDAAAGI